MVAEVIGGLFTQSLALLADAGHMMTDSFALALAWIAAHLARRPADLKHSYGFHRAEVLAAWVNAILLAGIALSIMWEAVQRLGEPQSVLAVPMLAIASVGLAVNIGVFYILHRDESGSINIRVARLHVLGDLLGSLGAIAAAAIILVTGWTPADALLSILIALLILRAAWAVLKAATHILVEGAPEGFDRDAMARDPKENVPGLRDVHHVHAWQLTSGRPLLTLHVAVEAGTDPFAALSAIKMRLRGNFAISHSVVQVETENCTDNEH
jgi:cobalt-zinc-cadmium efflux system protein